MPTRAPALFDRPAKKENEMDRYALERDREMETTNSYQGMEMDLKAAATM
jgi:hypothetical protein